MLNKVKLLKERYAKLEELKGASSENLQAIERELDIVLPEDFKQIAQFYDGRMLGGHYFYSWFYTPDCMLVEENKSDRKAGFPCDFLILNCDDGGLVYIQLSSSAAETSQLIWTDQIDFYNICEGKGLLCNPTIFPSFTDFFEYLIEQEEKDRAEDEALAAAEK